MSGYAEDLEIVDGPELVSAFDELSLWSAPFGKLLLDHLPMRRGMRVLDVGCGTGFPMLELAERLGSSSLVVGVDLWRSRARTWRPASRPWRGPWTTAQSSLAS